MRFVAFILLCAAAGVLAPLSSQAHTTSHHHVHHTHHWFWKNWHLHHKR